MTVFSVLNETTMYFIRKWFAYIFAVGLLEFSLECRNYFVHTIDLNYNGHTIMYYSCKYESSWNPHARYMCSIVRIQRFMMLFIALKNWQNVGNCSWFMQLFYYARLSRYWHCDVLLFISFFFLFRFLRPLKVAPGATYPPCQLHRYWWIIVVIKHEIYS